MRIYIDLDTLRLRAGILNPEAIPGGRIELKRGDSLYLDAVFVRDSSVEDIDPSAPSASGKFMIKRTGQYDSDPLVSALAWQKIGSGQSAIYRFTPSLNTSELNAELGHDGEAGNDIPYADLLGEIEWIIDGAITSTIPFAVRVHNDLIKGDEGVPTHGAPSYPAPGEIEILARKGVPDGYAPLNGNGQLPPQHLPPHTHPAAHISFQTQSPGTGNEWSPADGDDVAARANEAFHSVSSVWSDHNTLFGFFSSHTAGMGDRHQIAHIDGLLDALNGRLLKDGPAQTLNSPLHITEDVTLAGKTISGVGSIFFDDARPAVKGTAANVSPGTVAVFDGNSGATVRAHIPTSITDLPASPTNAEIATKVNQLLAALRSLGIIA